MSRKARKKNSEGTEKQNPTLSRNLILLVVAILVAIAGYYYPTTRTPDNEAAGLIDNFKEYLFCINNELEKEALNGDSTQRRNIVYLIEHKKISIDSSFIIEYEYRKNSIKSSYEINALKQQINAYKNKLTEIAHSNGISTLPNCP